MQLEFGICKVSPTSWRLILLQHQSKLLAQAAQASPQFMGVGSVGSTLCIISSKHPRNDHIPIDLDRFWWNCRIDFTIPFENPSPRSELEICVNNPDRDLDLGSKIGADPRQNMAKGDRGKQMRRNRFCASKNRKSKNAQNQILDVRF